ncbi:unnamed protein product [Cercospora beticola]|nr:unnamed protein product [Cercospora beticola]
MIAVVSFLDSNGVQKDSKEFESVFDDLILTLDESIRALFKTSAIARKSVTQDRYARALNKVPASAVPGEDLDLEHLGDMFPRLKSPSYSWLRERLAKANNVRRRYLQHCEEHQRSIESGISRAQDGTTYDQGEYSMDNNRERLVTTPPNEEDEVLAEVSSHAARSAATSVYAAAYEAATNAEDERDSVISLFSYETDSGRPMRYRVVDLNTINNGHDAFICPYCHKEQLCTSQARWVKHVLSDIKSYVCIDRDCDAELFETNHAWMHHQLTAHLITRKCPYCEEDRYHMTADDLKLHLRKAHSSRLHVDDEEQLAQICKISEQEPTVIKASACPFCDWKAKLEWLSRGQHREDEAEVSLDRYRRHIGAHLEQAALSILPVQDAEDTESDRENSLSDCGTDYEAALSSDNDDEGENEIDTQTGDENTSNAFRATSSKPLQSVSGVKTISFTQLLSDCISITETVIEIVRAAQDAKGLPPKLKELFERLPAINELLQTADERTKKDEVSKESMNGIQSVLEQCKASLEQIRGLFYKACPEDGDNYGKRFWQGTTTVFLGRDSKLQQHMNDVINDLKVVELNGILSIDGKLDQLAETVQVLADEDIAVRDLQWYGSGTLDRHDRPANPANPENFGAGGDPFLNFYTHGNHGSLSSSLAEQCLQSLAFPDMEVRSDINQEAEHTCEWIFEHEAYRNWIDRGGLLWIRGRAGTGKSTLMKYIRKQSFQAKERGYQRLQLAPNTLVVSFFFNWRGDVLHRTAVGLFRSVLHQILRHDGTLLSQFMRDTQFEHYHRTKGDPGREKNWDWTESDLRGLFRTYVKGVTRTRDLRLYVDALDEGGEQVARQLMALFKDCRGEVEHQLSICVSCRPYPQRIHTYDYCIDIAEENQQDITRFLEQYFGEWPDWDNPESLQKVKEEILSRSSGVFLWIVAVVPRLVKLREEDLPAMLGSIASLPQNLDDLYHDMFKPLREDNSKDKRAALRLFRWVTFAKRPLTLGELRYAVAIDADAELDLVEDCKRSAYWCQDDEKMLGRLRRLSFGMVGVTAEEVRFDHESVRDYMLTRGFSSLEQAQHGHAPENVRGRSEAILSRVCLRYLTAGDMVDHSQSTPGQKTATQNDDYGTLYGSEIDQKFLLGPYARKYCWTHASLAEAEGQSLEYIFEITKWPDVKPAYTWKVLVDYYPSGSAWETVGDFTLQHLAAYHGLYSIFEQMISREGGRTLLYHKSQSGLDRKDYHGRTPLWYAALRGREAIVKLLLDSARVDVNSKDYCQRTPLATAVAKGHESIVRLLLDNDRVDVNVRDALGRSPFAIALEKGHENIVRLLLDSERVDVYTEDHLKLSPMAIAASHGHDQIVRLLRESGRKGVH